MSLNEQSPIPLYRQLAGRIQADIDAGVHAVASRIPSENELADRYGIGRPTVRQATDLLVRRGKLRRRRGSGTYVLPPTQSIDLFSLSGTSAALRKSELNAKLTLASTPVEEIIPQKTQDKTSEQTFLRLERCASVDSTPVLFETLWLRTDVFPDLQKHNLAEQSVSALVRDVYFLEPTSADQTFFAISANKSQATRLLVKIGTPLLRVCRNIHFGENRNALHTEIVCLTDHFEFSQTLHPANAAHEAGALSP